MLCKDTWTRKIPDNKLAAYKQLISDGFITNHHVVFDRSTGSTIVEYESSYSHEWIHEELKKRSEEYATTIHAAGR